LGILTCPFLRVKFREQVFFLQRKAEGAAAAAAAVKWPCHPTRSPGAHPHPKFYSTSVLTFIIHIYIYTYTYHIFIVYVVRTGGVDRGFAWTRMFSILFFFASSYRLTASLGRIIFSFSPMCVPPVWTRSAWARLVFFSCLRFRKGNRTCVTFFYVFCSSSVIVICVP